MWLLILITVLLLAVCAVSDIWRREVYLPIVLFFLLISLIYKGLLGIWWRGFLEMFLRLLPGAVMMIIAVIRKKDLGMGDAIIVMATGYILGSEYNLYMLMGASILSGLYGIVMMCIKKRSSHATLPFVPFLLLGCIGLGGYLWANNLI